MAAPRSRAFSAADFGAAVAGRGGAGGGGGFSWWALAAACSTSRRVMAPCGPVPVSPFRSTPRAAAVRRATGDTHSRWPTGAAGAGRSGAGDVSTGAGAAVGSGRALGAPGVSPGSSSVARGVPTATVCPTGTSNSCTTPSCQHSISTAALVVSTTATIWPRVTVSPGLTRHSSRVPSSMSAPRVGITKSIIAGSRRTGRAPRRRSRPPGAGRPVRGVWRRGSAPRRCRPGRSARRVRRTPARRSGR